MRAQVDLPLALGEVVGSAVYVCTFGLAVVIFVSPEPPTVLSGPYVRDTFFYLVAVSMCATSILDSNFELHESVTLVVWCAPLPPPASALCRRTAVPSPLSTST